MDSIAARGGFLTPALFMVGLVLLGYTLYMLLEQRRSMVFEISRGTWAYGVAVALIGVAVGNFVLGGAGLQQVATAFVLFCFASFIATIRNGVGRTAIYLDGVRHPWSKVSSVRVRKEDGAPVLLYTSRNLERTIRVKGADYKEFVRFVNELSQVYGFTIRK